MLHWINWIVLLSLEPLAGELKYASMIRHFEGRVEEGNYKEKCFLAAGWMNGF
jgi:hypothetical protein